MLLRLGEVKGRFSKSKFLSGYSILGNDSNRNFLVAEQSSGRVLHHQFIPVRFHCYTSLHTPRTSGATYASYRGGSRRRKHVSKKTSSWHKEVLENIKRQTLRIINDNRLGKNISEIMSRKLRTSSYQEDLLTGEE